MAEDLWNVSIYIAVFWTGIMGRIAVLEPTFKSTVTEHWVFIKLDGTIVNDGGIRNWKNQGVPITING